MNIREARVEDAEPACEVLRRSITELCQQDHGNDREFLCQWLANKTPDNFEKWVSDANTYIFVAEESGVIFGVAAITGTGHIQLNYVSPTARFRGVSKALLKRLEDKARELRLDECGLRTTKTARRFYISAGYVEEEPPTAWGQPMSKRLAD